TGNGQLFPDWTVLERIGTSWTVRNANQSRGQFFDDGNSIFTLQWTGTGISLLTWLDGSSAFGNTVSLSPDNFPQGNVAHRLTGAGDGNFMFLGGGDANISKTRIFMRNNGSCQGGTTGTNYGIVGEFVPANASYQD